MLKYRYWDLKSAFDFSKENPNATIEDFFEERSKFLNDDDKELFKDVEFTKIDFKLNKKKPELLLFKSDYYEVLENFVNRFTGNKKYYKFEVYDNYGCCYSLITFDEYLFDIDRWKNSKEYKSVKFLENKDLNTKIIVLDIDEKDESVIEGFCKYMDDITINKPYFYIGVLTLIIEDINKLKFESILKLF